MNLENLKQKYDVSEYSDKTVNTIKKLITSLEQNYDSIDTSWEVNLELLAMNYELLYKSYDDIKANGNTSKDYRDRLTKNPSVNMFANTINNINNIMSKMGFNILSKVRAKQLLKDEVEKDEFEENFE